MELAGLALLLVVALGIVVLIVILFTRGVFARDLTNALKRVTQQEQELQGKADILEQRLTQMEREYQAKLKRAHTEADAMLQDAKQQAMNIRTAAIEEAKHRARQLLLEAEQGRSRLKAEVTKELNGIAIRQACEALRGLLSPDAVTALHGRLVKELIEQLAQPSVTAACRGVGHIAVTAALPLPGGDAQRITEWAKQASSPDVTVDVTLDPALVAGCILHVGTTVVDNSLVNRVVHP